MKRIATWPLGTLSVVTLLFSHHTSTAGPATSAVATAPANPGASGTGTVVTGSVAQTRWGHLQSALDQAGL